MHTFAHRLAVIREQLDALTAECYALIIQEPASPPAPQPRSTRARVRPAMIALFAAGDDIWTAQEVQHALAQDGVVCPINTVRPLLSDLCAERVVARIGRNRYRRVVEPPRLVRESAS
jgi:hypothetical protein